MVMPTKMTPDDQEARSMKWERGGSVTIRQLRSGNFAMYQIGGVGSPFWIGPATDLLAAYASRPPVTEYKLAPLEPKPNALGIDLNQLNIDL